MHRAASLTLLAVVLGAHAGCAALPRTEAWPRPAEQLYHHAAVAADHPLASRAGLEILQQGGNAVDAAIATSFCLSVVRPYSCGIGGGGFMLIAIPSDSGDDPQFIALDYRETAPAAVGPDYYANLDNPLASRYGVHASGVPGTVAGLLYALEHYGTLDRATVLAPAIRAAEQGVPADANHAASAKKLATLLKDHPELKQTADPIWRTLCLEGKVRAGDLIRNPDQAEALRLIAERGAAAFYDGPIADAIVAVMHAHAGPITREDLADYRPAVTEPLVGAFLGRTIVSMPPPSSGGVAMQQILGILQRRWPDLRCLDHNSPEYVHLLAEAMKHAFADRAEWLADPDFVDVPVDRLLDPHYLDRLALSISLYRTNNDPFAYGSVTRPAAPLPDDAGTSHFSVIDSSGMAVACTETINLNYGSLLTVPGFGFALNNEMDDFTTIPGEPNAFGLTQSDRNLPAPGKRPLSSMSPTIVLQGGRPVLIAGGSGGPRIITGTLQCLLNCLIFGMTPAQAVSRARFHHQWMPNTLCFEDSWPHWPSRKALQPYQHDLSARRDIGVVQIIGIGDDGLLAASDPRKGGEPAGY